MAWGKIEYVLYYSLFGELYALEPWAKLKEQGHEYSRTSNPTRSSLEALLTSLETSPSSSTGAFARENTSGGECLVFASGSAATAAMCSWVALAVEEGGAGGGDGIKGGGGHILAVNDVVSLVIDSARIHLTNVLVWRDREVFVPCSSIHGSAGDIPGYGESWRRRYTGCDTLRYSGQLASCRDHLRGKSQRDLA